YSREHAQSRRHLRRLALLERRDARDARERIRHRGREAPRLLSQAHAAQRRSDGRGRRRGGAVSRWAALGEDDRRDAACRWRCEGSVSAMIAWRTGALVFLFAAQLAGQAKAAAHGILIEDLTWPEAEKILTPNTVVVIAL